MKMNGETIEILKNFTNIYESIVIYPGNTIRTRTEGNHIISEYTTDETFGSTLAISDLQRFLSSIKILGGSVDLQDDNGVLIMTGENGHTIRYGLTPERMIINMDKSVPDFDSVVEFTLTTDHIKQIKHASSALNVEHLSIESENGNIVAKIHQMQGVGSSAKSTDDYYSFPIQEHTGSDSFNFIFEIETLPKYPGSYDVTIAEETLSMFKHTEIELKHWVATLEESEYSSN